MNPLASLPARVTIYEVGPRDGLQNESGTIPTNDKIHFVDMLSEAGLPAIEVTSFVRPGAIPQLADAERVVAGIESRPGVIYTALVPNERGMERAMQPGGDARGVLGGVAVFTAASETFSQRNTNATIDETLERFQPVVRRAKVASLQVRGYVSTAFGCPYEGAVDRRAVVDVCARLAEMGIDEIVVSDTIGVATPGQVAEMVDAVAQTIGLSKLALHFHDTRGTALANVLAGLLMGVSTFDASAGGLGGCPYAPGAAGNLATEDLVYMLDGLGIETGVMLDRVVAASRFLAGVTGRVPVSRYVQAVGT